MTEHIIDATKKSVGRVATEAAILLMGKNAPTYQKHISPDVMVKIKNASHALFHARKLEQGTHKRYSGHPGGLTITPWKEVAAKKGYGQLFRVAVAGMLPKNKLRPRMLKRLVVEE